MSLQKVRWAKRMEQTTGIKMDRTCRHYFNTLVGIPRGNRSAQKHSVVWKRAVCLTIQTAGLFWKKMCWLFLQFLRWARFSVKVSVAFLPHIWTRCGSTSLWLCDTLYLSSQVSDYNSSGGKFLKEKEISCQRSRSVIEHMFYMCEALGSILSCTPHTQR